MQHLEPCEPRQLMTNTGLDETFGVGGAITFPKGYRLRNTLGAANAIFVDLYHAADNTRWIYKYGRDGKPETTFGDNGHIQLSFESPATDVSKLAVDGYYGDLYVAAVSLYEGDYDLDVQRFRSKTGKRDRDFSTKTVVLPAGRGVTGEVSLLEPIAHRQLLIGQTITQSRKTGGGNSVGTHSLRVTRLRTSGSADLAFDGDGTATVAEGNFAVAEGGTDVALDQPTMTQLTGWGDDTYRVVDTRHTYHYQLSSDLNGRVPPTILSGTDLQSADSVIVNADGSLATGPGNDVHVPLVRTRIDPAAKLPFSNSKLWVPLAAQADLAESVWVIGGRDAKHGQVRHAVFMSVSATQRQVKPYEVSDEPVRLQADLVQGLYFLRADDVVTRLDFFWEIDRRFGRRGRITLNSDLAMSAVDSDGALLARTDDGRRLYRFDGTL